MIPKSPMEREWWHGARSRKCTALLTFRDDDAIICPLDELDIVWLSIHGGMCGSSKNESCPHTQSLRDQWIYIYIYTYIECIYAACCTCSIIFSYFAKIDKGKMILHYARIIWRIYSSRWVWRGTVNVKRTLLFFIRTVFHGECLNIKCLTCL